MIPVRMYQGDSTACKGKHPTLTDSFMGKHQHFPKSTIHSRGWFRSTDLWVMGPARFLCATLLNEA